MNCVKGQKKRERVHFKAGTSAKRWNSTAQEPALNVEHPWHPSRIRRDHLLWPGKETKLLLLLQGGRRPGRQHTLKCFPLLLLCEQLSWKTRSRCVKDILIPILQATQAVMVKPGFDSTAETSPWALRHFSPPVASLATVPFLFRSASLKNSSRRLHNSGADPPVTEALMS